MHRFNRLTLLFFAICFLGAVVSITGAEHAPNVVLILADDLGWSDLGCYGGDLVKTPHIDRLAQEGVRFTDFYSASPVCSPTRASILTGKHPARLHMTTWFEATLQTTDKSKLITPRAIGNLPHSETSIASILHDSGYVTALIGKWHLGDASHYPEVFGFDVNIGGTHWGAPETFFFPYRGSNTWGDGFRYIPHLDFGNAGEYLTDRLTDEALQVMDRAQGKPFFLYFAHHGPHTPVQAKASSITKFQKEIQDDPKLHHRNATYAAMIESLDESVGRVMSRLQEIGEDKNTIVIFTSDNGGYIGKWNKEQVTDNFPLRSGKGALYEGGIRVPLIIHWPRVAKSGTTCDVPTISTDLFATLADIVGKKAPEDGESLISLLRDGRLSGSREALFFHYPHYYQTTTPVSAVRAGDWKLLHYYENDRTELYNLHEDLSEKTNLASQQPQKAAELKRALDKWLQDVGAELPVPNPKLTGSNADK